MDSWTLLGTRLNAGDANPPPPPDNENLELMAGCKLTPAEVLQWVRRRKQRLCRELAMDAQLWHCPEHRRDWNASLGIEQLILWQCYGIRDA
jgi:hypothetical protein